MRHAQSPGLRRPRGLHLGFAGATSLNTKGFRLYKAKAAG